jgi:hypothetical protein
LAGLFTGLAAKGFGAVTLVVAVAGIGTKDMPARQTLPASGLGAHMAPKLEEEPPALNPNQRCEEEDYLKKKEDFCWRISQENESEEYQFPNGQILKLLSRR